VIVFTSVGAVTSVNLSTAHVRVHSSLSFAWHNVKKSDLIGVLIKKAYF
jgi:hypothetical protein